MPSTSPKCPTPQEELAMACQEGRLAVALVKERGVDVNVKDEYGGRTLLHIAASNGHLETVRSLVTDLGADVCAKNNDGMSALSLAASKGHNAVVCALVEMGASVAETDAEQMTPLHWAADSNRPETARLLARELGAEIDARDEDGLTPLMRAAMHGFHGVIITLLKFGADGCALAVSNYETASLLAIETGADMDECWID